VKVVNIEKFIEKYSIHDVGEQARKVNEACPVARVNPGFSPERIALLAEKDPEGLVESSLIWECLACHLCREVTGGRVDMSRFIRDVRQEAANAGFRGTETHGGILITAQRLNANTALKPRHTDWITAPLKVAFKKSEYLYWVGGAPFLAAVMPELKPTALDSARAAIRLLNRLGIEPVVLPNERFSGHDLLWTGDIRGFRGLAEQNLLAIKRSGAKVVIVSSPEDYYTLAKSYGEYCGGVDFDVCHITEFVAKRLSGLKFSEWRQRVAYHDPCRLGRGMGVYDTLIDGDRSAQVKCWDDLSYKSFHVGDEVPTYGDLDTYTIVLPSYEGSGFALIANGTFKGLTYKVGNTWEPYITKWGEETNLTVDQDELNPVVKAIKALVLEKGE